MANYTKTTIGKENRIELHEKLSLTGSEISLNELPAGANVPFVHSHKENEEIYGVILSILVYTFFSRMFDLMLPPVAKHSIVVA